MFKYKQSTKCDVDAKWPIRTLKLGSKFCISSVANMLLLVKCYDIKMVQWPGVLKKRKEKYLVCYFQCFCLNHQSTFLVNRSACNTILPLRKERARSNGGAGITWKVFLANLLLKRNSDICCKL